MILNAKQTRCLEYFEDKRVNEICYGGAAGGGKSVIGSYCLLKSALRYPRTRWLMGRARIKDLRETTLQTLLRVCAWQGVKPEAHFRINNSNAKLNPDCVEFFNGSTIILKELTRRPSDPNFDSLGSLEITGAFIDEASQVGETAWNVYGRASGTTLPFTASCRNSWARATLPRILLTRVSTSPTATGCYRETGLS